MDAKLIKLLQERIAGTSVGASAARGMGPKGTIAAARKYLARLNLSRFDVSSEKVFRIVLNRVTRAYVKKLPKGGQYWGSTRKFLNIFLRGVLYNKYLCDTYDLDHIEPWLEIPLDSHVAKRLHSESGGQALPRWKNVIGIDAKTNKMYQDFASKVAAKKGISRIHLDLYYWRHPQTAKAKRQKPRK